jgi:hypothetical protein
MIDWQKSPMAKSVLKSLQIIEMYKELIRNCTVSWANDGRTDYPNFETEVYFKDQFREILMHGIVEDTPEWHGIQGSEDKRTYHL